MRKLQTQDVFNALRAIGKASLKEEIKPILKKANAGEMNVEDVGIEGVLGLIEIFSQKKSEQAIYDILSGPFEMKAKDVEQMDILKLAENLETLGKENDLKRFFTLLAGLITKKQ
ncbi:MULTISPECIES: hypothetical protein [unclassified Sedimentibacter]|uniref:hypothetical protein n=1 Tax=unclassified Sedimentibacter TaxID=2649220 RepID=UPI0027E00FA2|nr:hypothetical protein [Sedimentibacter sp. MB35-C1]WMJ78482.1 hypothetical protein RBQ61_06055 [Sedimentibacter sp. MB35-C1]